MAAAREGRVLPGLFHFAPTKAGCLAVAAALWGKGKEPYAGGHMALLWDQAVIGMG